MLGGVGAGGERAPATRLGNAFHAILSFVLTPCLFLVESASSKSLSISAVDFAECRQIAGRS